MAYEFVTQIDYMNDKYILKDKKPVPAELVEWANWFETADRVVAKDEIGDIKISTVFLGLDYSFGAGKPLLFETMIFGGENDQYQERYSTWEEAEAGHKEAVALVKISL